MTLARPVLALRRSIVLALRRSIVLALAAPVGACIVPNPVYILETDGATAGMTGAGSTDAGSTAASSIASVDTSSTDAVPTTDAITSGGVTSTTASTLPSDTTTDATLGESTIGESSSDSSTGVQPACEMQQVQEFFAVDDAFFIAGGSDNHTTCEYYDGVGDPQTACKQLNFGTTPSLRVARMEGDIDAMFAVRFPGEKIADFVLQGNKIVKVQLVMTVYDQIVAPIEFRVGMITEQWMVGDKNGTIALQADSSFEFADIGVVAMPWTGDDGPRGASIEVATLLVPVGFDDHAQITSTPFDIDPWLEDPFKAHGLVVSFDKNAAVGTIGPGFKAMESGGFQPRLRVTYCQP